jgi:YHS domain-containing protein
MQTIRSLSFGAPLAFLAGLFLAGAQPAQAREAEVYTSTFSSLAVGGYDTVAFFTMGKPVEGKAEFETEYKATKWRFVNADHLAKFKANPTQYAPQYGGYCSWAVSQGYLAGGFAQYWKIVDGKLYLNYDQSVQDKWVIDIPGFIAKANANWPGVLDK